MRKRVLLFAAPLSSWRSRPALPSRLRPAPSIHTAEARQTPCGAADRRFHQYCVLQLGPPGPLRAGQRPQCQNYCSSTAASPTTSARWPWATTSPPRAADDAAQAEARPRVGRPSPPAPTPATSSRASDSRERRQLRGPQPGRVRRLGCLPVHAGHLELDRRRRRDGRTSSGSTRRRPRRRTRTRWPRRCTRSRAPLRGAAAADADELTRTAAAVGEVTTGPAGTARGRASSRHPTGRRR